MYGQFVREMPENVDRDKTWQWSKCDLKIGTEALLCAAQEQAIRTNYVKHYIDKTSESPLCRLCGRKGEACITWYADVRNWLRKNIRDDTTM